MQPTSATDIALFAQTNFRGQHRQFGIKLADRLAHMYLIGKTGVGKSTLLETLIKHDLTGGHGIALIDPHGDLVQRVLSEIPEHRKADVVYFNVPDTKHSLAFNPLQHVPVSRRPLAASGMLNVFKRLWQDSWGPRLEHILRNALLALLDQPEATLADVLRLLDDREFRAQAANNSMNQQVRNFWLKEYEGYPARLRAEAIAPVQNKVGAFLSDPVLNRILTQPKSSFRLRDIMDHQKILLVNLAKGVIGEDTASLLGSLLVARLGLAALSRADIDEAERRDFFVYLDEFHSFATLSLTAMLSELRKFHTGLILSQQYLAQVDDQLRDAIFGNVGTIICFRVGAVDAELLAREFYPYFSATDLTNLPNHHIYLKLMIDGIPSSPFSAVTLPKLGTNGSGERKAASG
jgi:type IV secretory pathway TraG/TraD family ATPase VirD4